MADDFAPELHLPVELFWDAALPGWQYRALADCPLCGERHEGIAQKVGSNPLVNPRGHKCVYDQCAVSGFTCNNTTVIARLAVVRSPEELVPEEWRK
jgi:hypothetical protein